VFGRSVQTVRRGLTIALSVAALTTLAAGTASAAPKGYVGPWSCDGQTVNLNFGAPPNQSSNLFVDGTSTMFVIRSMTIVDAGELVYSFDRGLAGFAGKSLVTCSTTIDTDTFTVLGYFTPRQG